MVAWAGAAVFAQPSLLTDVVPRGGVRVQADLMVHPQSFSNNGWVWLLPAVTLGVGARSEISAGQSWFALGGPDAPNVLLKAKTRLVERGKFALAAGGLALLPVANRVDPDRFGLAHLTASYEVRKATVSFGGYRKISRQPLEAGESQAGVIVGLDRALPCQWRFCEGGGWAVTAQWMSGVQYFGYSTVGVAWTRGAWTLASGYGWGNSIRYNHGPFGGLTWTGRIR